MSRLMGLRPRSPHRFPRVSGDEPRMGIPMCSIRLFSPRERG